MINHPRWPEAFLDLALQVSCPGNCSVLVTLTAAHPTSDVLTEEREIDVTAHCSAFSLLIELNSLFLPGGRTTAH